MYELSEATDGFQCGLQQDAPYAVTSIASLRQLEKEASHNRLREKQLRERLRQEEKLRKFLLRLGRLWPVGVGVVLACYAPELRDLVAPFQPWGMRLLFPFVVICGRQEIQMGGAMTQMLPQAMLYLQFPAEGLLAKIILKNRVTLTGVAGQLFLFHFLGVVELWLVSVTVG
jgi:branched-subunit amino acid transport protein AzlD